MLTVTVFAFPTGRFPMSAKPGTAPATAGGPAHEATPERIAQIITELTGGLTQAIKNINEINRKCPVKRRLAWSGSL
jgi:hypothetical protein